MDCKIVQNLLNSLKIACSVYPCPENPDCVDVEIVWGDWKHAHLAADYAMACIDGELISETITESADSDAYSAIRRYQFKK